MEEKPVNLFEGIAQPWIAFNQQCWSFLYERTLGSFIHMPLLGPSRDFNHQLLQSLDAWANLCPVSVDYQLVLIEIQLQAVEELLRSLPTLTTNGELLPDVFQVSQLWSRIADQVYEKAFCTEANLKVRGNLLNAINHYKLCQQQLMELWMKGLNLPSRHEIDDIHRNIYELRKEVKKLKQRVQQSPSPTHLPSAIEPGQ